MWRRMRLTNGRERLDASGRPPAFCNMVMSVVGLILMAIPVPARAVELSAPIAALYSTVSIFPPSAKSMTICYGFVCRRREVLDFTPGDRNALTQLLGAGKSSAAAERAAVQKAVVWFDRRMGPVIGTNKRVAKADFGYLNAKPITNSGDPPATPTTLHLGLR